MKNTTYTLSTRKQPRHHYSPIASSPSHEDLYEAKILSLSGETLHTLYYLARPGESNALIAKLEQLGYSAPEELLPQEQPNSYRISKR
ncbi:MULTISPECIES: hypothetical protein [Rothia]|uniref:hypothetical protein n=1 Tax=Rothia TaxID=32207 RepID=UPI002DD65CD8|nr:hypothetical protein [Rothia nasimurium]